MPRVCTSWMLNAVYAGLLALLGPILIWRAVRHGRYRRGLRQKFAGALPIPADHRPAVWFHAVSVGEVIQLRKIVAEFRTQAADQYQIIVTTSTDTGFDLARQHFPESTVTWFPLDFSWAVSRALHRLQPALVVLMELELWPNFISACSRQSIPVAVVNGRISDRSFRGYSRIRRITAPMLRRTRLIAAQTPQYAERLIALGAPHSQVHVTGSVKFDGVVTDRRHPATQVLRELFGIRDTDIVFIAGSTQSPEEELALCAWQRLQRRWPALRLILVPRHRERFEEVAHLVQDAGLPLIRRSMLPPGPSDRQNSPGESRETPGSAAPAAGATSGPEPVILLDTIGELGACWGLAEIAFVGGSFGSRGGQNMIEPAAYGAAVLFGPHTSNFRDVVATLQDAAACLPLAQPEDLLPALEHLLTDPGRRQTLGRNAQQIVLTQQGATSRTVSLLTNILDHRNSTGSSSDRFRIL